MKCPNCKKEIDNDSKFCEYCGVQIKKNMKPLLITICVIIGLLALGVFGYYQYDSYARTYSSSNGHDWVDLGLSVKWATCNVGASSPEEYGNYYAWGETTTKERYYDNCPTYELSTSELQSQGYIDSEGNLTAQYDAATANWGGRWRMPTEAEMQELLDNCTWTWTTQNGVNGYKVTSKKNGNSIFLPAAGDRYGSSLYDAGNDGNYWSSTPRDYRGIYAYDLDFDSSIHYVYDFYRFYGYSVRPVLE